MKEYNFCTNCNNQVFKRIRVIKSAQGFKIYGSCSECLKSNQLQFRYFDRVDNVKMKYLKVINSVENIVESSDER